LIHCHDFHVSDADRNRKGKEEGKGKAMGSEVMGSEATGSGAMAAGAFFFSIAGRGARVGRLGVFSFDLEKLMGCERPGCVCE
jgi:hypothetical protein